VQDAMQANSGLYWRNVARATSPIIPELAYTFAVLTVKQKYEKYAKTAN
jgi:hypothetical protein